MKSHARSFIVIVCLGLALGAGPFRSAFGEESPETPQTDGDIFRSRAFREPLVPIGPRTESAENTALALAIALYAKRTQREDRSAILSFLEEFPRSPWRAAILTNIGLEYRDTGWFLKALASFEEAWELSKNDTSVLGKPLADRAIGELAALNTHLGRRAEIEAILAQIKGRPLVGTATEYVTTAREGLWQMRHDPGNAFKCGPFALARIRAAGTSNHLPDPRIVGARSTDRGMSLDQLWDLSKVLGMEYQMAKRSPGSFVPVPSLINWKAGHYAAVIQERNGLFLIQDTAFGRDIWVSKAAVDSEASGYFLIPAGALPQGWRKAAVTEAKTVWGAGYATDHDRGTKLIDDKVKCDSPMPMAHYNFHTQEVSLNIMDTPVGYTPPLGPDMHFTVTYNQREYGQPAVFDVPNFGPKWVCNWIAFVKPEPNHGDTVNVHIPGGGSERYDFYFGPTPGLQSGASMFRHRDANDITTGYTRTLPDGSREVYGLNRGATGVFYMTKLIDPKGLEVNFDYDPQSFRLRTVTDAVDQVFTISYKSDDQESLPDYYLITRVEDFASRAAIFEYTQNGQLWKIHDAIGITSEFRYNESNEYNQDFITTMITPYGSTTFSQPVSIADTEGGARTLQAVEPDGIERLEYQQGSGTGIEPVDPNIPNFPIVPGQPPSDIIQNVYLDGRNSFYWDKKAMAMYPPNGEGIPRFDKAKLTHWLHLQCYSGIISNIKGREKRPLESPVYYRYFGQGGCDTAYPTLHTGTQGVPSIVARRLDDSTLQVARYEYANPFQKVTKAIDPNSLLK